MSRARRVTFSTLVAVALVACSADGPPAAEPGPMPADGFGVGWQRSGTVRLFTGAELYGHINGGAEVYLELGFRQLEVQRYSSELGEVSVELYHMADPVAALGVYLRQCGAETSDPAVAARHTLSPHQAQLVKGGTYACVNVLQGDPDMGPEVLGFTRHLAENLPPGDPGPIFSVLPEEGRVPGSERVIRGPFTLEAVYTLGQGDILGLEGRVTAVAAEYDGGEGQRSARIVASYPEPADADRAFARVAAGLDPYLEVMTSEAGRLVFKDYAGLYGEVEVVGATLNVCVKLASPPPARDPHQGS